MARNKKGHTNKTWLTARHGSQIDKSHNKKDMAHNNTWPTVRHGTQQDTDYNRTLLPTWHTNKTWLTARHGSQ